MRDEARGAADRRLEAEGEVATARLALDDGELEHAAEHLAGAAALDPSLPDTHEALAELAARAGGARRALEFFPLEGDVFIGTAACRAHLCAALGRWEDAVQLLATVAAAEPGRPWLDAVWMARPDLAELLPARAVAAIAARVGPQLPEPLPEDARLALRPLLTLVRAAVRRSPGHAALLWAGSSLARRIGDPAEAVEWARRSAGIEPSHPAAVMLGYALRRAGDPEGALRVWQERLTADPSDLDLHVDVAELLAATGRPQEGLEWIGRALAADPRHPKAAPAGYGLRFLADGDIGHLVGLADHLREHPEHDYADTVLEQHSRGRSWLGRVPLATEATAGALRAALKEREPSQGADLVFTAPALEPPSVRLALHGAFPGARLTALTVPRPDPRRPVRPVDVRVWRYDGTRPRPAVPPPSPAAARAVRDLAAHTWPHPPGAYDRAVLLSGLELDDLLGCLVHPPAPGDEEPARVFARYAPDVWVRSVQVWSCLGIAHHRADEPWPRSRRRTVLIDLLYGPEDWVTEAAAFTLLAVAWVHPETRPEVAARLAARLAAAAQAARTREVTVLRSLAELALLAPGQHPVAARQARTLLPGPARPGGGQNPVLRRRGLWDWLRRR